LDTILEASSLKAIEDGESFESIALSTCRVHLTIFMLVDILGNKNSKSLETN
jgi:hypothetical protein